MREIQMNEYERPGARYEALKELRFWARHVDRWAGSPPGTWLQNALADQEPEDLDLVEIEVVCFQAYEVFQQAVGNRSSGGAESRD
jgi:hypothetical protein